MIGDAVFIDRSQYGNIRVYFYDNRGQSHRHQWFKDADLVNAASQRTNRSVRIADTFSTDVKPSQPIQKYTEVLNGSLDRAAEKISHREDYSNIMIDVIKSQGGATRNRIGEVINLSSMNTLIGEFTTAARVPDDNEKLRRDHRNGATQDQNMRALQEFQRGILRRLDLKFLRLDGKIDEAALIDAATKLTDPSIVTLKDNRIALVSGRPEQETMGMTYEEAQAWATKNGMKLVNISGQWRDFSDSRYPEGWIEGGLSKGKTVANGYVNPAVGAYCQIILPLQAKPGLFDKLRKKK